MPKDDVRQLPIANIPVPLLKELLARMIKTMDIVKFRGYPVRINVMDSLRSMTRAIVVLVYS